MTTTLPPDMSSADSPSSLPPDMRLSVGNWLRKNLFNNWYNALFTIVGGIIGAILLYFCGRFVFVTGEWEAIRRNLSLLMIGNYPRSEQWRLVVQMYLIASAIGLTWGTATARSQDRAMDTGTVSTRPTAADLFRRYWAILLLIVVILVFTRTIWPTLFTLSTVAVGLLIRSLAIRLPRSARKPCFFTAGFMAIVSFQVLSGTGGISWWWMSGLAVLIALQATANLDTEVPWHRTVLRAAVVVATVVLVRIAYWIIGDVSSVGWDDWAGLYITLVVSGAAIILAFPLSMLLALGRRSSLPIVRWFCVTYIEFFRGIPLIILLFTASIFISFFLDTDSPLSLLTRATIAFTIFSSAYLAEVVRGGLQAVPKGQVEAGQAAGLSPPAIMRLIVLPQALRAVIPAMVGQFISLFKDSSLLSIISIVEFYRARELIHSQQDFLVNSIAETLVFAAFGYWAFCYTMSKESQRLERHLGVGER